MARREEPILRSEGETTERIEDGPKWSKDDLGDVICEHGTAIDVHCCGCHSGFLFDSSKCICF